MKKLSIFISAMLLVSSLSFATIRRVGFNGTAIVGVDYNDLQAAHNISNAGDTIQIYGSGYSCNVSKKIIFIGFGYNFDVHPSLQAVIGDAPSGATLFFGIGSDGSVATGLSGDFNIYDITTLSTNNPTINNITFLRCNGSLTIYNYGPFQAAYGVKASNINFFSGVLTYLNLTGNSSDQLPVSNLNVFNCILQSINLTNNNANTSASFINCVSPPNNVGFTFNTGFANILVKNCILAHSNAVNNINTIYVNNFFNGAQPAIINGSNNRWSQDWAVLFNRLGGTDDYAGYAGQTQFDENYFILKTGSPAINGGVNGSNIATDCGIFGGETSFVYKPSGVPAVPSIYKLTAPTFNANSNPFNVTISVKSNN